MNLRSLNTSYKWNHIVVISSWLAYFTGGMCSDFIHVLAYDTTFFLFKAEYHSSVYVTHFLYPDQLSIDISLCFHLWLLWTVLQWTHDCANIFKTLLPTIWVQYRVDPWTGAGIRGDNLSGTQKSMKTFPVSLSTSVASNSSIRTTRRSQSTIVFSGKRFRLFFFWNKCFADYC